MKYNTTYSPKVSLRDTISFIDETRASIIHHLKSKYNLTYVYLPGFYLENDQKNVEILEKTRSISFDISDEFRVGKLALSSSSYLSSLLARFDDEIGTGIYAETSAIWRDTPETPMATIERHELYFMINVGAGSQEEIEKISQDVYSKFLSLALYAKSKYKVQNIWPRRINFITAQEMENEFLDKEPKVREVAMVIENEAYILKNPGKVLRSGHFHTKIPNSIYNNDNFMQIILKDRVNSQVIKVASIGEMIINSNNGSRIQRESIIESSKRDEKLHRKIVELKINVPKLVMALLGKGHISEVQPGVYTEEQKMVELKYRVETL